ncbi:MAG TPA: class I SAM-dependent methyltransferase [Candidatus Paceibacterota bacterium]|nr:class I SAM-dependent methyltransferase [Candidatus Paceibacterota bacterium]
MGQAEWARKQYNSWEAYDADLKEAGWEVPDELSRAVAPYLRRYDITLDVGCGTGLLGAGLRFQGYAGRLIGLDAAEERLAEARARTFAGRTVYDLTRTGDAYRLPWHPRSFNAVVSSAMLGLTGPRSLVQMLRVLRKDGILGIVPARLLGNRQHETRYRRVLDTLETFVGSRLLEVLEQRSLGTGYHGPDRDERYVLYICRLTRPYRTGRPWR